MINETLQSGIDLNNVIVGTDNPDWIEIMENKSATDIRLAINMRENPSLERFQAYQENYTMVIAGDDFTNELYRQFNAENIPVLVYTIDSPERYYQLWSLGVTWVMTNEAHTFNVLENPMYLTFEVYLFLWVLIYIGAISTVIIIKLRNQRESN